MPNTGATLPLRAALLASGLIILSLIVLFPWIFPGSQAIANWTQTPADWEHLRRAWESGHVTNADLVVLALLATGRA